MPIGTVKRGDRISYDNGCVFSLLAGVNYVPLRHFHVTGSYL